ncbi:MAG: MFS transporter [Propionibacteriaceae bacterium]|nr:MFS transporter [Propionibacteriaceae bacterium]
MHEDRTEGLAPDEPDDQEPRVPEPAKAPETPPPYLHWLRTISIFLTGQTLSLFGSALVGYSVIWYITLKTGSGWQYAILFIASNLCTALTTVPGGVWADRYSRKKLMIGADAFVAFFTVILAIVMLLGYERLWLVVVVLCLRGLAGGIQSPAVNASIPQLVPTNKLLRVNSLNASIQSLTFVAAPALAAVMLVYLPLGVILLSDVLTALIGIGCVLAIKIPRIAAPTAAPEGVLGYFTHMAEAARYGWRIAPLRRLTMLMIFFWAVVFPPCQMTPVLVVRLFGPEQWKLAATEILWSVGMVLGGVLLAAWGGMRNRMTLVMIVCALWGVFTVAMGLAPNLWVFLVIMVMYGLSVPGFNTAATTSVQELIPDHLMGRMMGFITLISTLATPLGMAIVGPLADVFDIRILTVVCGALGLVFVGILALDRGPASKMYAPTAAT